MRRSLLLVFVVFLPLSVFLAGCGGSGRADGDTETEGEDVPQDGDLESEQETDGSDRVVRELLEGTIGWCRTTGPIDRTCDTAADCVGYRVPIPASCEMRAEPLFDCAFATRGSLPADSESVCSADRRCDFAPRACVNGACAFNLPDDTCTTDADCTIADTGCYCFPIRVGAGEYDPGYGPECEGRTACPAGARGRCVLGACRVVGEHLDAEIEAFCVRWDSWEIRWNTWNSVAECVESLKRDDYKGAALSQTSLAASADATSFKGFGNGPWEEYLWMVSALCAR